MLPRESITRASRQPHPKGSRLLTATPLCRRRSLELVVPLVAIFAQLVALGFLFRETFRPHVSSSFELSTPAAVATGTTASDMAYKPLSTRMIHLSRRGKVRWSRVRFWPRGRPQMPDMMMMSEATDLKQQFVLSDDEASSSTSSSVGSSRPSTPSSGDDSSSTPSRADGRPRHGLLI